jgi:hypothetical protein
MSGIFIVDSIRSWFHRRQRDQKLEAARSWQPATGEVNHWELQPADKEADATGMKYQIHAAFHFTVNGEYYGGYVRSVAMVRHEAETVASGNPAVHIRYDPANPDSVAVLAEDNTNNLPFRVYSG